MEDETWYEKQIRQIELQHNQLNDRYNQEQEQINENDIEKLLNSNLRYAPAHHHTWSTYASELTTHVKYADEKNTKAHIEGKRPWYTHRSPLGCFMCEDIALRHVMLKVIQAMANQYPKTKF